MALVITNQVGMIVVGLIVGLASGIHYGGTHRGEFAGFPAAGKKFNVMGIDIVRFNAEGKAVEHWSGDDAQLKMMQQLGAIPEGP